MDNDNLITQSDERIVLFFQSLEKMLDGLENLTENYRPMLRGERYLTDKEVSERLKLSRRVLQNYRDEGRLPYCKLGGKILYRESDIQQMLDKGYRGVLS
ncbi:MAG: helix-turn-helix domain-containing protein [Petrimonas sp.]|jgi:excisionase family DNA binding protein|nr:helix-turn-helix domain-containing protein [Petrimonas sp.]MDD2911393.1 helix-turn-helix domain-containing protein [Petrimonas sp.]